MCEIKRPNSIIHYSKFTWVDFIRLTHLVDSGHLLFSHLVQWDLSTTQSRDVERWQATRANVRTACRWIPKHMFVVVARKLNPNGGRNLEFWAFQARGFAFGLDLNRKSNHRPWRTAAISSWHPVSELFLDCCVRVMAGTMIIKRHQHSMPCLSSTFLPGGIGNDVDSMHTQRSRDFVSRTTSITDVGQTSLATIDDVVQLMTSTWCESRHRWYAQKHQRRETTHNTHSHTTMNCNDRSTCHRRPFGCSFMVAIYILLLQHDQVDAKSFGGVVIRNKPSSRAKLTTWTPIEEQIDERMDPSTSTLLLLQPQQSSLSSSTSSCHSSLLSSYQNALLSVRGGADSTTTPRSSSSSSPSSTFPPSVVMVKVRHLLRSLLQICERKVSPTWAKSLQGAIQSLETILGVSLLEMDEEKKQVPRESWC